MPTSKKVFVTGATGFLGSYLLRYLVKKNYSVLALKRDTSSMALVESVKDKVDWLEGDILDTGLLMEAMQEVDQIYHCAAMISHDPRDVNLMTLINQEGTENIVDVALDSSIEKMVYVSSIAAIGRVKKQSNINEKNKWERSKLNSNYAISKYQAEQEVWRGIAEGLNAAIVNPSVILGSGFWDQGASKVFQQVWNNFKFYPKGTTGFVDVRDVARMMIDIMESPIKEERFIANGENLSYQNLYNEIANVLNKKAPSIKVNSLIQGIAWRLEWIKSRLFNSRPLITKETATHTAHSYFYQNQKSIDTLGFRYTPIQQTIAETGKQFLLAKQNNLNASFLPLN